jgi:hypothetical protein
VETQLVVTVDAVIVGVVVRAVCALLRSVAAERGATTRRRIEAGERVAVERIRAGVALPERPGPSLAVSGVSAHSRTIPCSRSSATPPRSA